MKEALRQMLSHYVLHTQEDYESALREIVQHISLLGLWRAKFFEHAAFYGGTALRIFHQLNRFSEDMDFSLMMPDLTFELSPYLKAIEGELISFGFLFQAERKERAVQSQIESAFIKGNTVKNLTSVEAPSRIVKGFHREQKLKVKIELDIDPPKGATFETKFVLRPIPFSVRLYTLPNLFAGKLHAVLCRNWKSRVKGRDFYDFVWYVAQKVPCNLEHLRHRMVQTGHWETEELLTLQALLNLLRERFETIDFESAKTEVRPFIKDPEALTLWSKQFFIQLSQQINVLDS
jgi:predicted nucleotidyltransferase component of viral defense system